MNKVIFTRISVKSMSKNFRIKQYNFKIQAVLKATIGMSLPNISKLFVKFKPSAAFFGPFFYSQSPKKVHIPYPRIKKDPPGKSGGSGIKRPLCLIV